MTVEDNKRLILGHYESFVRQQDEEAIREQLAADFVDHEMPPGTPRGPEEAIRLRAMLHKAFPDLKIEIEDMLSRPSRSNAGPQSLSAPVAASLLRFVPTAHNP
ncbi:MAG: ester cyclase [Terracidiphilus sp.]